MSSRSSPRPPGGAPLPTQPGTVVPPSTSPFMRPQTSAGFGYPRPGFLPPGTPAPPMTPHPFIPPPPQSGSVPPPPSGLPLPPPSAVLPPPSSAFPPPPLAQVLQRPPSSMLSQAPPMGPPQFSPSPQYGAPQQYTYQQQQQQSSLRPPQVGSYPSYPTSVQQVPVPPPPHYVGSATAAATLSEQFESLTLAAAPGSTDVRVEELPRPSEESVKAGDQSWPMNCHPRYFKMTTNAIPNSHSLAARWHLPLGAVIHPLAEAPPGEEVPVVDFGPSGIVRCRRCRTYINPYAMFVDAGKFWRCTMCLLLNEVPSDYMCGLDENGKRRDAMERPELCCGTADFVAPAEYMVRPPMPPIYFFLIDVSASAVRSGMIKVAVETIKSCLDKLPGFPRTQIGFLTFDGSLHFFNLKSSLTQPQMMVMAQLDDPFLPLPDDLLVNLSESRAVVDALLDNLPSMFEGNDNIESALGPALQATVALMGEYGGKLLIFQSTLPSLGTGRLKLRGEDARIYGTDKEHTLRVAEESFYKQMAAEFSKLQIAVNIYAFSEKYTDLASLGTLSKYTGGQVCYYPGFNAVVDAERLRYDLARDLTRETAWEAVMRVRCARGLKYSAFQGHFMLRSSDLLALPAVDCDKAFSVQFALDDTLLASQMAYFQVALLYTSSSGERRIRVHTAAIPVVSDLGELYRVANVDAITGVLSRLAIEKSLGDKLENSRQFLQVKMITALREFRNLYSVQHQLAGRMVFPESLRLLPLYVLALCKSLALRGGYMEVSPDARSAAGYEMMTMSTPRLLKLLYPTLIRLDQYLSQQPDANPQQLHLSMEVLDPRGAFLLFDGLRFVLWLGNILRPDLVVSLLGPEAAHSADFRKMSIREQPNELSRKFHSLVAELRREFPECYQPCLVVPQGDASREMQLVLSNLVEDRVFGFPSYNEWMVQAHRQIQQKI